MAGAGSRERTREPLKLHEVVDDALGKVNPLLCLSVRGAVFGLTREQPCVPGCVVVGVGRSGRGAGREVVGELRGPEVLDQPAEPPAGTLLGGEPERVDRDERRGVVEQFLADVAARPESSTGNTDPLDATLATLEQRGVIGSYTRSRHGTTDPPCCR